MEVYRSANKRKLVSVLGSTDTSLRLYTLLYTSIYFLHFNVRYTNNSSFFQKGFLSRCFRYITLLAKLLQSNKKLASFQIILQNTYYSRKFHNLLFPLIKTE